MELTEAIRTRRSVRAYKPDPIPDGVLEKVLDCARLAPSANNVQPWHFVVVKDRAKRREIAQLAAGQSFVGEAPAVIVCCGKRYTDRYSWISGNMYLVDCTIAIDHLTLAARNEGLGTCWVGAFDHELLKKAVDIPRGYDIIMLIPIGHPATESAVRETGGRFPLKKIASGL